MYDRFCTSNMDGYVHSAKGFVPLQSNAAQSEATGQCEPFREMLSELGSPEVLRGQSGCYSCDLREAKVRINICTLCYLDVQELKPQGLMVWPSLCQDL